jgi:hypothetical protein
LLLLLLCLNQAEPVWTAAEVLAPLTAADLQQHQLAAAAADHLVLLLLA